jgi:hypothetical protein
MISFFVVFIYVLHDFFRGFCMDFSLLVCLYSSILEDVLSRDLVWFLDFIDEVVVKGMTFPSKQRELWVFFNFWDNFTNPPQTLPTFAYTPLTFKNSHLPSLNFQKFSLTPLRTN